MISEKDFTNKINERNRIRSEIKQKKSTLAKMVNNPELLEETLILKSEIETLELKLELVMK